MRPAPCESKPRPDLPDATEKGTRRSGPCNLARTLIPMLFVFLLLGRDYLHYLAYATRWERSAESQSFNSAAP